MRLFLPFSLSLLISFSYLSGAEKIDGIVAVVGDSIILNSELEAYTFLKINQLGLKPDSLEMNILRHNLLDELIEGKVLLVHAEKDTNISIDNEDIESELNHRINFILRNNDGITLRELETLLKKEQGISLAKFKEEIRQQIRHEIFKQKVQQFYISSDKINKNDIESFYNEYKDSIPSMGESILLSKTTVNLTPTDDIRQKAYSKITKLKELLDNGEGFSNVAKQYSDGLNASTGGDLGFIAKGTLNELTFEETIFSLSPGETSPPFETRLGFHIVKILDRKDQKVHVQQIFVKVTPPEQEVKNTISLLDSIRVNCDTKENFVKAVKKHSTDEVTKARDGQLKWQSMLELDPKIKNSFDTLITGNISKCVKKDNKISIYRIDEIKQSRKLTLKDDWNEIAQIAQRIYTQKKLIDLVNKWQKETFIDIRL